MSSSSLFNSELVVINLGLHSFAQSLQAQEVRVLQVDWRPPAGGDEQMLNLLDKLS